VRAGKNEKFAYTLFVELIGGSEPAIFPAKIDFAYTLLKKTSSKTIQFPHPKTVIPIYK
jgi:hypothetical protein